MMKQPFSNVQLELLKVFSQDLSDDHLLKLKKVLANFYYEITLEEANKVWNEEAWDEDKVEQILETKLRSQKNK